MFDKNIFAQRILGLRKAKNISQSELAGVLGVSYHAISKMENAQRGASVDTLCLLADYFECSLDYLVGRADNPGVNK